MATIYPPLSNIQQRIEDSIFHWIRKKIVEEGYLPDILAYPNTPTGTQAYFQAISAIAASNKGFAIEIFNTGSTQSNSLKKVPRIVLRHKLNLPGSVGAPEGAIYYIATPDGSAYNRVRFPSRTSDLFYDIHLVANTGNQSSVLHAIIETCLRGARYIPFYDNPQERFYLINMSHRDSLNTIEGLIENVYTIRINDVYLIEPQIYTKPDEVIAKITCIELGVYLKKAGVNILWDKTCIIQLGTCTPQDENTWLLDDGTTWLID